MKLTVLGCSGGIGVGLRTTSMLVDSDVLIDAGTGVGDLELGQLARIDDIFLTHAHLDHVCGIPFLADTVGQLRHRPVIVHAIRETIASLRDYLFNGALWPDFTRLPDTECPYLRFDEIRQGQMVSLQGRKITAIPASHAVPAVGYWLDSGDASLVFSGDTGPNSELWDCVNGIDNLRHLIIETAFCDRDHRLALLAQHLCPRLLAQELRQLQRPAKIYITHLKPVDSEITMQEVLHSAREFRPQKLEHGQVIEF